MKKPFAPTTGKPPLDNLSAQKFTDTIKTDYLVYLPKGYDAKSKKRWPLMMFLHGAGERGTNVWRATIHGPVNFIKKNPDFPFIVITPICPGGQKWSDRVLMDLLDYAEDKYQVDPRRIYLTGLSMGGYGTWSLGTTFPERFAAIAPICGGEGNIGVVLSLLDKNKTPALKKLPIWAFHGGKDTTVVIEESKRMVSLLKKAGNDDVKLTIYPEATHNSWTETYNNPELYQWFLAHELK